MSYVVDASVVLKLFVEEDGSPQAAGLLALGETLIAPDLVIAEACNAAWKAVRAGFMLASQHDRLAARLPSVLDELVPTAPLASRASAIARSLDHPVYDCFYLALAEQRMARLVTADRRLLRRLAGTEWTATVTDLRAT